MRFLNILYQLKQCFQRVTIFRYQLFEIYVFNLIFLIIIILFYYCTQLFPKLRFLHYLPNGDFTRITCFGGNLQLRPILLKLTLPLLFL